MSFFKRLVGIYIHPRKTFEDIARKPDFVLPLIAVTLMNLLVLWAAIARFGTERLAHLMFTGGAPELLAFEMDRRFIALQIISLHMQALSAPALKFAYVVAGALGIEKILHRRNLTSIRPVLGIAVYSTLVSLVGGVLGLGVVIFGNPERYNPRLPSPTSLGSVLDPIEHARMIVDLAGFADILTVWYLILCWVGISAITGWKFPTRWALLAFCGLLFVYCAVFFGYLHWPN